MAGLTADYAPSSTTSASSTKRGLHPTKDELIRTVVILLDSQSLDEITSEKVLEVSGISRGSLYHHFQDFGELLELAQVRRFVAYTDNAIKILSEIYSSTNTREEIIARLREAAVYFQAPELAQSRIDRLTAISKVVNNPRMAKALGEEQERLTQAIADLYAELQSRGLGNPKLEPRTYAVMFQAYTLGRAVDDFTINHVDQENWLYMISLVLENIFFPAS